METGRRIHHSAIQTAVPIAKDCAGVKVPVSAKAVNTKLAGPARISSIFFMRPPWGKRAHRLRWEGAARSLRNRFLSLL